MADITQQMTDAAADVLVAAGWEVGRRDIGPSREECDEVISAALSAAEEERNVDDLMDELRAEVEQRRAELALRLNHLVAAVLRVSNAWRLGDDALLARAIGDAERVAGLQEQGGPEEAR